jgi:actinin alpha
MAEELEKEGADVNTDKFASTWQNIFTLVQKRAAFIQEEEPKQKEIDELRHKFADAATAFAKMLEDERKKEIAGELEEQIKIVNADVVRVSEAVANGATVLSDLNEALVNFNVRLNPYTDFTLKGLKEMSESLMETLTSKRSLLEQQLNEKNGSKASPEEVEEYRELYRTFAKGGSGLKWFELKAVLSALGDDCDDNAAKKIVDEFDKDKNGEIVFEEFMQFMIRRRETSDTPEAIIESFREIAGGKDFITENELAPHLTPEQLEHAKRVMPKKGDGYDYTAYTGNAFK